MATAARVAAAAKSFTGGHHDFPVSLLKTKIFGRSGDIPRPFRFHLTRGLGEKLRKIGHSAQFLTV